MPTMISPLSHVDPAALLGRDVHIGPFCVVGPEVRLGDECRLESHVTIVGRTTIGNRNRFWPNSVIGTEPQDRASCGDQTETVIGDDNQFREGVTVHRGAEKEDGTTRIGSRNMFMANAHIAHNCRVYDDVVLVNGVLLGGHAHVHDKAIVSGNSAIHHFTTVGTLAFVGGCCRVTNDVPPYMMSVNADHPEIKTINLIGMKRAGISDVAIAAVKRAHRLLYREFKSVDKARAVLAEEYGDAWPIELVNVLHFLDLQKQGKLGRAREAVRFTKPEREAA